MTPEQMADALVATVKSYVAAAFAQATDDQLDVVAGLEARLLNKVSELEARIAQLEAGK